MRSIATICLVLSSCLLRGQTALPDWGKARFKKFEDKYSLGNYINPSILQADFSGDKKTDLAILIERKTDHKKGILILFAQGDQSFIAGAGHKLSNGGDNFDWADTWAIFEERITYETTFKDGDIDGEKEIRLERPAISIREEEGSGGLIYFDGSKLIWIHQGD